MIFMRPTVYLIHGPEVDKFATVAIGSLQKNLKKARIKIAGSSGITKPRNVHGLPQLRSYFHC